MRRIVLCLAGLALCATSLSAQQEVDNVAAFARLYGATRWFYPSDAAATLDWNRFAVLGVSRVRQARTPADLERELEALFMPLGPRIEIGTSLPSRAPATTRDASLIAWSYYGPGFVSPQRGPYRMKRTNRAMPAPGTSGSGVLLQSIGADSLRGRRIRMRGRVRVADPNLPGWAGLWLRVDRGPQTSAFFDNMQDRPVRDTTWREYVIEGPIASDATSIYFGALAVDSMTVDVDGIELSVRADSGDWRALDIPDASFEAAFGSKAWAMNGGYMFTRPTSGAADGEQFMRVAPPSGVRPTLPATPPADSLETPIAGATVDIPLSRGLTARVPLSLTDAEARAEPPALSDLRAALKSVGNPSGRSDVDARLADAVVAWNVYRHFYPYWSDIGVDWDARLRPHLAAALNAASTRDAHLDALRALVADVRDGHGYVNDQAVLRRYGMLPVRFRVLGGQLVVTASGDSSVPVGSLVTTMDAVPAADRVAKEARFASGTTQWREARAASALQLCPADSTVVLGIQPPVGGPRQATLRCSRAGFAAAVESRPDSIAELSPGIWYVDLTRVRAEALRSAMDTIAGASGVVFDMRGYPTDAGVAVLPYLLTASEDSTDRWMHVARIVEPFGEVADWQHFTWHLRPATPHVAGRRVFLTDGRAISYAESVMGYVRDYKLGTIIGGTTAGANGNVAMFTVPGGFSITFTGMRVTRHDGRTPFHTDGVSPDIRMEPTLAGIRAGRDELLDRALSVLRVQP